MDQGQKHEQWPAPSAGGLKQQIAAFNNQAEKTQKNLDKNPFSDTYERPAHKITDNRYGRPEQGSKTERRGIAAGTSVKRNAVQTMIVRTIFFYQIQEITYFEKFNSSVKS